MSTTHKEVATKKKAAPPPVVVESKEVAVQQPTNLNDWGVQEQHLNSRDIVIPKILAMQAMSKSVVSGEAKMGEFRDSLNDTVVGSEKHPIEFVPFYMEKVYVVMKKKDPKSDNYKFSRQVAITPATEDHEFIVETPDGLTEKWYRTSNFYVIFPKDIEAGNDIPHMLSFRSSSSRAGQKLATTMYVKNLKAKATPASMVMELSGAKQTNDKGTFIVMDIKEKRKSSEKEVEAAFEWVKTIRAGKVKVDHSDLESEANSHSDVVVESTEY